MVINVVSISPLNGGEGRAFHLMVDNRYWGITGYYTTGWHVRLQNVNHEYSAGDLEPLFELVKS